MTRMFQVIWLLLFARFFTLWDSCSEKKYCYVLKMSCSESRLLLSLVNVINRLMWSHFKTPFTKTYYIKTTGYCYHSVNVITNGLSQSDYIKRLLLYKKYFVSLQEFRNENQWHFVYPLECHVLFEWPFSLNVLFLHFRFFSVMFLDVMSQVLLVLERSLASFTSKRLAVTVTLLVTLPKLDCIQHDAAKRTSEIS